MSDRERWVIYPLLFLALGSAVIDKVVPQAAKFSEIECERIVSNEIEVRKSPYGTGGTLQCDGILAGTIKAHQAQVATNLIASTITAQQAQVANNVIARHYLIVDSRGQVFKPPFLSPEVAPLPPLPGDNKSPEPGEDSPTE